MKSEGYAATSGVYGEERWQGVGAAASRTVITSSLVAHTWAQPAPDHIALITDALVIFPWDKEVFIDGRWQIHPELEAAIAIQKNRAAGL
ncbi:MAG: hypothetical protein R6W76_05110 [Caldilinea sp.]